MLNKFLLPNFIVPINAFLQFLINAPRFNISAMLAIHFGPVVALGSQANYVLLRRVLVAINV